MTTTMPQTAAWLRRTVLLAAAAVIACLAAPTTSVAQSEDEEEVWERLRPGLLAEYAPVGEDASAGKVIRRLDDQLAFAWGGRAPDARLVSPRFRGTWTGRLFTITRGEYRLYLYAAPGRLRVTLVDKVLYDGDLTTEGWADCQPIQLSYGYHPLEVQYQPATDQARLALYWSGPQFQLEPVANRYLYHDPPAENLRAFEEGQRLVHALRCASCHTAGDVGQAANHDELIPARPIAAPSLANLAGNVHRDWLVDWLTAQPEANVKDHDAKESPQPPARRMPHFRLSADDAQAVAAYLLVTQEKAVTKPAPKPASQPAPARRGKQPPPPSAAAGRELFRSIGCLACHQAEGLGTAGLFGGGDLSAIAAKRPAAFFDAWLRDPAKLNADHRMPVFTLTAHERTSLSLYLASLGKQEKTENGEKDAASRADKDLVARGRALVQSNRCAACHALPQAKTADKPDVAAAVPSAAKAIGRKSDWSRSCVAPPQANDRAASQPRYALAPAQAAAIRKFYEQVASPVRAKPQGDAARDDIAAERDRWHGPLVLEERNCLACHARNAAPGIEPSLDAVLAASPELAPLLPGMKPPALHGVGDKLHRQALVDAIGLKNPPLRPWLALRMPKFDLADAERDVLVDHLIAVDLIPPRPAADAAGGNGNGSHAGKPTEAPFDPAAGFDEQALLVAGSRLVTSSGFGCTSCHQVGKAVPEKVELKSRGPDLTMLGNRLRRSWFDRWMPNPARIVPRMEMPSVVNPIAGVLNENVKTQLHAVWHVLNVEGFNPPKPNPVRIVRRTNVPGSQERAVVLTDVIEVDEQPYIKPLVIGLPNRHNLMFDLNHNRLAAWWLGDTATQHTRGKSWYWEPGGSLILRPQIVEQTAESKANPADSVATSELLLVRGDQAVAPSLNGQFPTEFDWFEHVDGGIRFQQRLRYKLPGQSEPVMLVVTQQIQSYSEPNTAATGFRRQITVSGVPQGWAVRLRGVPAQTALQTELAANVNGRPPRLVGLAGGSYIESTGKLRWALSQDTPGGEHGFVGHVEAAPADDDQAGVVNFELTYATLLPVDRYTEQPVALPVPPAAELDVAPGFKAVRLPLDPSIMPTALAWRSDNSLLVASLKGRVWVGRDTNGDGLEDTLQPFSDDFAAPYGLRAALEDTPSRPVVDVINKYALLRLIDRDGDGFAERVETIASGWGHTADYHDWTVGLPRDSAGNYYLAIPCQQDNRSLAAAKHRGEALRLVPRQPDAKNPHRYALEVICGGLRFPMGLTLSSDGQLFATDNQGNYNPFNELNHLQPGKRYGFINKLEFRPDFKPPLTPPAVNLPHPWTRSVNGVCFLEVPGREKAFGPFTGHLLGCEYDTRKLIRMSLQWVDGQYQGAAYPFSVEPADPQQALEGPLACEIAPDGSIYVGNIRDSAWGGGANTGSIVRVQQDGPLPPGIAEVRAERDGFVIDFTAPVAADKAANAANYRVSSYRRESTPAYGGPDLDRQENSVRKVELSADRKSARLTLDTMRPGFVYELRLENLSDGAVFFPDEAHYTLNRVPK